jgi:hypothetical protein
MRTFQPHSSFQMPSQREPHPFNLSFKYIGLIFEELSNCPKGYL